MSEKVDGALVAPTGKLPTRVFQVDWLSILTRGASAIADQTGKKLCYDSSEAIQHHLHPNDTSRPCLQTCPSTIQGVSMQMQWVFSAPELCPILDRLPSLQPYARSSTVIRPASSEILRLPSRTWPATRRGRCSDRCPCRTRTA